MRVYLHEIKREIYDYIEYKNVAIREEIEYCKQNKDFDDLENWENDLYKLDNFNTEENIDKLANELMTDDDFIDAIFEENNRVYDLLDGYILGI